MIFCNLDDFFRLKNMGFLGILGSTVVSLLLSASVERCFVSRMRDFQKGFRTQTDNTSMYKVFQGSYQLKAKYITITFVFVLQEYGHI